MSTKRRGAAVASPDVRLRGQKRRKVSEESPVNADESEEIPIREDSEPAEDAEAEEAPETQGDDKEAELNFEGDSIQTAQDKIMTELTRLKDADGDDVAYPFIGKPDRNLYRDYYEIIQHPTSLRTIQKQVRGTDSRKNPTKKTAFPTWKSFEDEVSYIWLNAREYNEDGSEISKLAGILEEHFKQRVAEAKKHVPDPIQVDGHPEMPRIKLKMGASSAQPRSQRLTLKMAGQTSETASKDDESTSGVTADNESSKRQQEPIRTASTSQEAETHRMSPRHKSLRRHLASPSRSSVATTPPVSEQFQTGLAPAKDLTGVIKSESLGPASQQHDAARPSNGLHGVPSERQDTPVPPPVSVSPLDSLVRRPGQDVSSALIRNVQIATHPSLSLQHDFSLDVPPSATLSQQSITINLPASHRLVTIRPKIVAGTPQRHVKMVALMGMQRLHPSAGDASGLVYDIALHPGTNKIDLEAIAGPARGVPKTGPPGSEIDYERVTIFLNLLR